ncbi:hypothetical protein E9531_13560 [Lampropedia puyangensis]|uniref:Uncharacterized protein n=1 Tax=Lampropedia puyangensis TaxID=1330072 RepID=A0A4S8EW38_9BURK|nr:hypothetical protein [Lampropedia puyangensis]THT98708.1 hypothetical protein E9531_13560 [Lampropedia puyangensis]
MSQTSNSSSAPVTFSAAYKRIAQSERCDDVLACIAMIAGKTLQEVTAVAHSLGFAKHGPANMSESLIAKVAMLSAQLVTSNYKDFDTFEALPPLALLYVDYTDEMEIGRHVLWHRPSPVKGQESTITGAYIIDPGNWIEPKRQITQDFSHLRVDWFLSVHAAKPIPTKAKA